MSQTSLNSSPSWTTHSLPDNAIGVGPVIGGVSIKRSTETTGPVPEWSVDVDVSFSLAAVLDHQTKVGL